MLPALCTLLGLVLAFATHNTMALVIPESDFLLSYPLSLALSNDHVCTISQRHNDEDIGGEAVCFGREDNSGKLQPPSIPTFVQIITGNTWACGLAVDQTVECWGSMNKHPVQGMFTQIVSATHWGCGIQIDKQVTCFGAVPRFQPLKSDLGFVQLDCSDEHCCALDTMAVPHCWGRFGPESKHPHVRPPRHLKVVEASGASTGAEAQAEEEDGYDDEAEDLSSDLMQMKQISVGTHFSCGITLDNSDIQCWGASTRFHHMGTPLRYAGPFKQLSVGDAGVCGLYGKVKESADGLGPRSDSMACWGAQVEAYVGQSPDPVHELQWDQVRVHKLQICGVTMNSDLKCFGQGFTPRHMPEDLIVA